jgi:hypothetical protein
MIMGCLLDGRVSILKEEQRKGRLYGWELDIDRAYLKDGRHARSIS